MKTPAAKTFRLRFWPVFWILCLAGFSLAAAGVWGCLHVSQDCAGLRDTLLQSGPGQGRKIVEIRLGGWTFGLARLALRWVNLGALEPEARDAIQALQALRGVEVGVYRLARPLEAPGVDGRLDAADEAMFQRGWERMARVATGHELVAVYVPASAQETTGFKLCVATLVGQDLVIAAARANLEPLLSLALRHARQEGLHLPLAIEAGGPAGKSL
jgi:hypothetical protein